MRLVYLRGNDRARLVKSFTTGGEFHLRTHGDFLIVACASSDSEPESGKVGSMSEGFAGFRRASRSLTAVLKATQAG